MNQKTTTADEMIGCGGAAAAERLAASALGCRDRIMTDDED